MREQQYQASEIEQKTFHGEKVRKMKKGEEKRFSRPVAAGPLRF
ncbi:hypothetical protein Hsw_0234 [Hymenobacter swuensis DY53]|uniref:Uncharacterized protein n=1 Tax=Hymenobacter swuensis DY53 TaxID=1227739 RepID=W8ERP4_9BACT|nr:hypothetical protein Hsw_0234 [Hymenobacter swuensis DY53]